MWIKANVVMFLEMTSETTMANVKLLITKKSMLYFWERSFSSKHRQAGSLGSRQVDVGQIFFLWCSAGFVFSFADPKEKGMETHERGH